MTDDDQTGSQSAGVSRVRGAGKQRAGVVAALTRNTSHTVSSLSLQKKSKCPSMTSLSRQRLLHSG